MTAIFQTPREKAREERNKKIVSEFQKLKNENPDVAATRIIRYLAEKNDLTFNTVKNVVTAANIA